MFKANRGCPLVAPLVARPSGWHEHQRWREHQHCHRQAARLPAYVPCTNPSWCSLAVAPMAPWSCLSQPDGKTTLRQADAPWQLAGPCYGNCCSGRRCGCNLPPSRRGPGSDSALHALPAAFHCALIAGDMHWQLRLLHWTWHTRKPGCHWWPCWPPCLCFGSRAQGEAAVAAHLLTRSRTHSGTTGAVPPSAGTTDAWPSLGTTSAPPELEAAKAHPLRLRVLPYNDYLVYSLS